MLILPRVGRRVRVLLAGSCLLFSVAVGAALPAQSPCADCSTTGTLACRRCLVAEESGVQFCSVVAACRSCRGGLRRDCRACPRPTVEAELQARQRLAKDWIQAQRRRWRVANRGDLGGRVAKALVLQTASIELVSTAGALRGGTTSDAHRQVHRWVGELQQLHDQVCREMGWTRDQFPKASARTAAATAGTVRDSPRYRLVLLRHDEDQRRICLHQVGLVHQGLGPKRLGRGASFILRVGAEVRDAIQCRRELAHGLVHLIVSRLVPAGPLGAGPLGARFGWIDAGLAHRYAAAGDGEGRSTSACFHEHAQAPLPWPRRPWREWARDLNAAGALPAAASVVDRAVRDFTPEHHVAAFALVQALVDRCGGARFGKFVLAIRAGATRADASTTHLGVGVGAWPGILAGWLGDKTGAPPAGSAQATPRAEERRPHVALYVYTRQAVRPRHGKIVQRALAQRAAAHTSGWGLVDGKPLLALGPVGGRDVRHWRNGKAVTSTPQAWPFAAVLEFDRTAGLEGVLDWFRRRRGSRDRGAWFLDPAGTYVAHLNAETVCDEDDRFCYMAVVDTPTGDAVQTNDFVVRGRVTDGKGRVFPCGWLVQLNTPKRRSPEDWTEDLVPLTPWMVLRRRGVRLSQPVPDLQRHLAAWGDTAPFQFPQIPDGVRACRPRR